MIIDAWMQHPTLRHLNHEMFASLRRWVGEIPSGEVPVATTLGVLRQGDVSLALAAAWCGPQGWLISNDEVAGFAAQSGGLLRPVASANLYKPMEGVRELRRAVREHGCVA